MSCFELVAITGGVADLPSVPFEIQVGVQLALCGRGRQVHSITMVVVQNHTEAVYWVFCYVEIFP